MPSFGEKLKQEREKRNITLDQISATTKISTRMLQALEEDKFNQLPGGIFNKGFVRAYSRCVGLDEDQIVADYLQASGDGPRIVSVVRENDAPRVPEKIRDKEPEKEQATVRGRVRNGVRNSVRNSVRNRVHNRVHNQDQNNDLETLLRLESSAETPPRQLPWGLFAAILLLIALALVLLNRRHEEHEKRLLNLSGAVPSKSSIAEPASASGGVPPGTAPRMVEGKAGPASIASGAPLSGHTSSAQSKTSQRSEQPSAPPAPGEFAVVIQAREDCWLSITSDGKTLSSELLAAGTERTVRGQKEIVVKAGNAGGVDFQFNGKKVNLHAEYGEVKTITFGPGGLSQTTPPPASQL